MLLSSCLRPASAKPTQTRAESLLRLRGGCATALLLLCCNNPDVVDTSPTMGEAALERDASEGLDSSLQFDAHVSCPGQELLTTLGWSSLPGQHQLGEVYIGALDYAGDEPCIALRFDSLQDLWTAAGDQPTEPLTLTVDDGLALAFSEAVPLDVRGVARTELIDAAQFRLEGVTAGWLEPAPAGWLGADPESLSEAQYQEMYRLRNATYYGADQFVFIVTRVYSADRVTELDGSVDGLGTLHYPRTELETSYDCPALPLGDVGADFYDGVFLDATEGFSNVIARADLPRRFCPDLPGSARPPGNGALLPPSP